MAVEQRWVYPYSDKKDDCLFCDPTMGGVTQHVASWQGWNERGRAGNLAEIVFFESKGIKVIPDSLPVKENGHHVLLVRKPHRTAYAQDEDVSGEVIDIMDRLHDETGKQWIFAEHGGGMPHNGHEEKSGNQSVWHAHGHAIEIDDDGRDPLRFMKEFLRQEGWHAQEIPVLNCDPIGAIRIHYDGNPYAFFQYGSAALWVVDREGTMKSMLTQRAMSRYHGEELRWKDIPKDPRVAEIATRRLMNLLSRCGGTGLFTTYTP
jgi:hypothetical protein